MKLLKLNDVWNFPTEHGIIYYISNLSGIGQDIRVPWDVDSLLDVEGIDFDLHYNHIGEKYISPFLASFVGSSGKILSSDYRKICMLIYNRFIDKWNKLYAVKSAEYNPIENYDRDESTTVTADIDRTNTGTTDLDKTGTVSTDNTGTSQLDIDTTTTTEVNAYNSGDTEDNNVVVDGTNLTTNNLNQLDTFNTNDKNTLNLADTEDSTTTTTSRIHGNIGVTTTQQMLQSEIDLWYMYDFWKVVYDDIDKILCLNVY